MHQIGAVGLSYRHAGVEDVARLTIARADLPARLPQLREAFGVSELLYLGTCNRVELLYVTPEGVPAGDLRPSALEQLTGRRTRPGDASRLLRAWAGESAIEHVLLLACGLESAQAGEREISSQLRLAWEAARAAGTCGPVLDRLLGEALGMAARVHRLQSGVRPPSLADLAATRVLEHLGAHAATVALIGVSPMTRRCGLALHGAGVPLLIVNRTLASAAEFAQTVGGTAIALERFRSNPPAVAALVLAAGGGNRLLEAPCLRRVSASAERAPLAVDFGVPPNIDPEEAREAGIIRVGMSQLVQAVQERRLDDLMRLAPIRAAIDERLSRLRDEMATRAIGRRLAELRGSFEQIAADEAERTLEADLRGLDPQQRAAVERLTTRLAHRLAHLPLAGLRAAAAHASPDAVEAFFREARLHRHAGAAPTAPGAARAGEPRETGSVQNEPPRAWNTDP